MGMENLGEKCKDTSENKLTGRHEPSHIKFSLIVIHRKLVGDLHSSRLTSLMFAPSL